MYDDPGSFAPTRHHLPISADAAAAAPAAERQAMDPKDLILADVDQAFAYAQPTGGDPAQHQMIREHGHQLARTLVITTPVTPELASALAGLDAVVRLAHTAISNAGGHP